MQPEKLIEKSIRHGARLVRALTLAEGALALAIFVGGYFFVEIILDHVFTLSSPVRAGFLAGLACGTTVLLTTLLALPLVRSINRAYIAHRVESAFPHFKNSLVTFVQLQKSGADEGIVRLVGYQAASCFEGVDIDAGLDSRRFVRSGYVFVGLVIAVFLYSILAPKSMWTSFMRSIHPWADIPAPTRVHIHDIQPGFVRVMVGSDVPISADISGDRPVNATIRWSRDGELWQSMPMQEGRRRWQGTLAHVETNLLYYVRAGDASSQKYTILTAVPPVVESLTVTLTPPSYTGLPPTEVSGGNITALVGTRATFILTGNKDLASAVIRFANQQSVQLKASASKATGSFKIDRSGRYAIVLKDAEGLSPAKPVEYDITAVPDHAPKVAVKGPGEGESIAPDTPLAFEFDAADDYGLSRLVFHFESDPSNANIKNYAVPEGAREFRQDEQLTANALGARSGDTVYYYLEAVDNKEGKPNSARTPTYAFKVAGPGGSTVASPAASGASGAAKPGGDLPGEEEKATGEASNRRKGPGELTPATASSPARAPEEAKDEVLRMLEKDQKAWDIIAKHVQPDKPATRGQMPASPPGTHPDKPESSPEDNSPEPNAAGTAVASDPRSPLPTKTSGGEKEESGKEEAKKDTGAKRDEASDKPGDGQEERTASSTEARLLPNADKGDMPVVEEEDGKEGSEKGPPSTGKAPAGKSPETTWESSRSDDPSKERPDNPAGAVGSPSSGTASRAGDSGAPSRSGKPVDTSLETKDPKSQTGEPQEGEASSVQGASGETKTPPGAGAPNSKGAAGSAANKTRPPEGLSEKDEQEPASGIGSDSRTPTEPGGGSPATQPGVSGGKGSRPPGEEISGPGDEIPLGREAVQSRSGADERVFATRDLVKRLSEEVTAGKSDPSLLADLGWKPSDLRTFVRRYEDVLKDITFESLEKQASMESDVRPGGVVEGHRDSGAVGTLDALNRANGAEKQQTNDIPREDVAPEYKRIVDEYYRSITQRAK